MIPSGIFQPSSLLPTTRSADFDLWRNIQRELAEKLLGMPEADRHGRPVDYGSRQVSMVAASRWSSGRSVMAQRV
ncbi:hypothetical protein [Micromonospora sp. NPDC049374]|uniref:hypothetical protein n=1 Tax=Micromonospora sp. NPDC049374 TaxID=3154352 RepID=UPI00343DE16D